MPRSKIDGSRAVNAGMLKMAVIYRIRNKLTGKCYIGETKEQDPYKRWKQHRNNFKRGVGCTALRDAFQKYGEETFEFQILFFCFDEDRFHYEIEAIAKYNTQVPNGYNIAKGGQGGGAFVGKKHKPESIQKIKETLRVHYDNPELIRKHSERTKCQFDSEEKRLQHGNRMKNSEKFRKAVEEGRVGGGIRDYTDETRNKISESLKKHFDKSTNQTNVENHRKAMAKAVGKKVYQYGLDGSFIKCYESIKSAARELDICEGAIRQALDKSNRTSCGFIWRTTALAYIEPI